MNLFSSLLNNQVKCIKCAIFAVLQNIIEQISEQGFR